MLIRTIACAAVAAFLLESCVRVPSFDSPIDAPVTGDPKVLVLDVVKRVKCELYWAMKDHLPLVVSSPAPAKGGADKSKLPTFDKKDPRFWLSQWDATVRLELVLNEQGSVAPGVTFTDLLKNAYNAAAGASSVPIGKVPATYSPGASAITQSFSLGIGGGVTTQAVRTDDIQFSMSMAELVDEFDIRREQTEAEYKFCTHRGKELGDGAFLEGGLGLEDWTESALGPTLCRGPTGEQAPLQTCEAGQGFRYLRPGVHPPASSTGPTKPIPVNPVNIGAQAAAGGSDCKDLACIKTSLTGLEGKIDPKQQRATDLDKLKSNLKKIIAPIYKNAKNDPKLCPTLPAEDETAYNNAVNLADQKLTEARGLILSIRDAIKNIADGGVCPDGAHSSYCGVANGRIDEVNVAISTLEKQEGIAADTGRKIYDVTKVCPGLLTVGEDKKPVKAEEDPPLDSITHTVQFVVATSINATPSWNLARFKSATSPALLNLAHNNTQTLSIVLGPSSAAKAPDGNQQAINAAALNATLRELLPPP